MTKNNVPRLRFKEFSGEWVDSTLSNLVKSLDAGVSVNSEERIPKLSEYSILKTSCVTVGYFNSNERKSVTDAKEIARLKEPLLDNSIILSRMNTPLLVAANAYIEIAPQKTFLPDRLWQLKVFKEKANMRWLSFWLSHDKNLDTIRNLATGTSNSMKNITKGNVMNTRAFIPSLPEQTKIASFLSSVDNKLTLLTTKRDALIQYKKGVMQQIFNQEIRFKDEEGRDYPDWEEKTLGEVGYTYNGLVGKNSVHFGQGEKYIQYKQVLDNQKINVENFGLVNIYTNERQNKVEFGDVFFTISSETSHEIAMASVLLEKIENVYLNSFCFGYRYDFNVLYPYFSGYIFRSLYFRNKIIMLAQGSTRYNISKLELLKISLKLPCIPEQTKIARFLMSLDDKISAMDQQIEKVKDWKKGLLQGMFV